MRVKYIGERKMNYIVENNDIDLTPGKVYEAINDGDDYHVIDDSGEDYLYPKSFFEVINEA